MDSVKSVLIIDDDEDDLYLIEDRLSQIVSKQCIFVTCFDKHEAISLLKERTFDLCILDFQLGGYEGIEILDAVADAELATPIVMLTGQNDDKVARQAIKSGAQDFVMKALIDDSIFEKSVQYAIARKELEFARVLSQRNEAENVAKDKFIAHLSHELRTPLTSVLGYTAMLLENPEAEAFNKELNIISNNGKHLLNLLNDVLDLSKIAADKFELKEVPTDLQKLLIEVNSLLSVSAIDKGLFLSFDATTLLPAQISIDGVRFRQVMVNLIGNAIKFTDTGGISIQLSLQDGHSASTQCNDILSIKISDTGIGMAEHQLSSIFTPFKQIEDVANRKAGGAGLGLSITAEILKQMGGELKVESNLGEGSTFTLNIPCKAIDNELVEFDFNHTYDQSNRTKAPQLMGSVLVVDDVFEIRQLAGYFIKETGVQVSFAGNGEQALLKISQAEANNSPFDLIFMDLHMPILTGEETVRRLRDFHGNYYVVAMTAAVSKGLFSELLQKGFDQLISKPLNKSELWSILSNYLPKKKSNITLEDSLTTSEAIPQNTLTPQDTSKNKALIHVVEDDQDSAMIMQMMLEQLGAKVILSHSAAEAIENSKSGQDIHLHLLDLGLPDLQGEAFLEAFFSQTTSIRCDGKVCIVSGNEPDPALLENFPISEHLVKPVNKDSLVSVLKRYL